MVVVVVVVADVIVELAAQTICHMKSMVLMFVERIMIIKPVLFKNRRN